ncbi:MAG: penicillin-insensitive murein endopeptidase [Rubrimonas sp.]
MRLAAATIIAALAAGAAAAAQPAASALFSARPGPAPGVPEAIGGYARGCIVGARQLPERGPGWQAMRLSRTRTWGHPDTIAFIERLGAQAQQFGWPRLLIGDISQPRGGPMPFGHASHQIGLDIDIWLTRPGARPLSRDERETVSAVNKVAPDRRRVAADWTEDHARLLRAAAMDPAVARIFVNAAIKTEMCRWAPAGDREWLRRIRPWWGHDHHFHVRLACPADSPACVDQDPIPAGDGCDETLAWWLSDEALNPPPSSAPAAPRQPLTLADLPPACAGILDAR